MQRFRNKATKLEVQTKSDLCKNELPYMRENV